MKNSTETQQKHVVTDNLSDSIKEAVETAKQKIIDGEITVDDGLSD